MVETLAHIQRHDMPLHPFSKWDKVLLDLTASNTENSDKDNVHGDAASG